MQVRTGLFKYVRYKDIEWHHKRGWMIVANLGTPHNEFSVLMWRCYCALTELAYHGK
jgi:hypothetical protein